MDDTSGMHGPDRVRVQADQPVFVYDARQLGSKMCSLLVEQVPYPAVLAPTNSEGVNLRAVGQSGRSREPLTDEGVLAIVDDCCNSCTHSLEWRINTSLEGSTSRDASSSTTYPTIRAYLVAARKRQEDAAAATATPAAVVTTPRNASGSTSRFFDIDNEIVDKHAYMNVS